MQCDPFVELLKVMREANALCQQDLQLGEAAMDKLEQEGNMTTHNGQKAKRNKLRDISY